MRLPVIIINDCWEYIIELELEKLNIFTNHTLTHKLTSYGITGNTHNWITYFLSNRKQRVWVNGALSDTTDVTSGVPQCSVLGPILFLLYINDINENIQSSIRLFADDSIIYRKINSNIDHQILQTDLIQLEKWSDKWQMQFNI